MPATRKPVTNLMLKAAGLFLLAVFLQWAGMTHPTAQEATVYAQIAHLVGAGPTGDAVAKLPPQQ